MRGRMSPEEHEKLLRQRISEAVGGKPKAGKSGIARSTIDGWIKGPTLPKLRQFLELCAEVGRDPCWFFETQIPERATLSVPKLDVRAAAGAGAVNEYANVEGSFEFPEWMVDKLGVVHARLRILRARGDSMEPTLTHNALLLVEEKTIEKEDVPEKGRRKPNLPPNDIFVFRLGGDLRVKRVHAAKGGYMILSDNPEYDPEFIRGADRDGFAIVGRVVWWCNWL